MLIRHSHDGLITMIRKYIGVSLNHNCYTTQYNVNLGEVGNVNRIQNDEK